MKWFFLSLALMALAACSAAPSESAIQTAIAQTTVVKEVVQVTSPATANDAASPVATAMAPSDSNGSTATSGSFTPDDLVKLILQANEVSLQVHATDSYKTPQEASRRLTMYVNKEDSDKIPLLNTLGHEWISFATDDDKSGIVSFVFLFQDPSRASQAFKLMANNIKSGAGKNYQVVNSAGLGDEGYGIGTSVNGYSRVFYYWRVANVVLFLGAEGAFAGNDVRTLADKMQSHTKPEWLSAALPTPTGPISYVCENPVSRNFAEDDIIKFVLQPDEAPAPVYSNPEYLRKFEYIFNWLRTELTQPLEPLSPVVGADSNYNDESGKPWIWIWSNVILFKDFTSACSAFEMLSKIDRSATYGNIHDLGSVGLGNESIGFAFGTGGH